MHWTPRCSTVSQSRMIKKITVGILFGGRSAEHEVSLCSARTVVAALNLEKYSVVLIGIDRQGRWYLGDESKKLLNSVEVSHDEVQKLAVSPVALTTNGTNSSLISLKTGIKVAPIDVIFPVLHGPYGEDGTIQGLAKLANCACVGAGVLGSAIGMDKDVMKRLLRDAGIPIGSFVSATNTTKSTLSYQEITKKLGSPLFIKPANMGSSVGVSKVSSEPEFVAAVNLAFQYDRKIIAEEYIEGREIECSVLGNDMIEVSVPGEIIAQDNYYSYHAKYSSSSEAKTVIPADLSPEAVRSVQNLAKQTYQALECRGLARVDFFYTPDGRFLVNEINTLPGFTSISMYPKLWEATGLTLPQLVDKLITLALENFDQEQQLITSPS